MGIYEIGRRVQIMRDIDKIVSALKNEFPACQIARLQVTHPADDNNLWFFKIPGKKREVQMESLNGNCPFIIELSDSNKRLEGKSVDDVLAKIRILYS